jgi:hypothetical protein
MPDQDHSEATAGEKVVHQATVWRDRDKEAIANRCEDTKRAEYLARQRLREAVDLLEKSSGAR